MLTQSNDKLVIKNGLPKCRQGMIKNHYAVREHGKLVRIIVLLEYSGVKLHPITCHEDMGRG